MIALTQESKIALIEHAEEIKDRLSEYCYPFQPHKTKQLLEIALASITAEPVNPADCFGPVYLSPPVPEIKLPSMELIKEVFLANGFKEKTQPDGTVDLNPYVYDATLALIKRLNGLGE